MKGIVFTELLEMVEDKYGDQVLDHVITKSDLPNQGGYTAVGTYDHDELVRIIAALAEEIDEEIPVILKVYGRHIFKVFALHYPHFFADVVDSFSFLESIESHIHVEVKKLYPEAELPTFESSRTSEDELKLTYISTRKMGDFAFGLIEECLDHFGDKGKVEIMSREEQGAKVHFKITR